MLSVKLQNKLTLEWHVGENTSRLLSAAHKDLIVNLQASDDELEYILRNIPNVPYPKNRRVVVWYGDMARFIAANL